MSANQSDITLTKRANTPPFASPVAKSFRITYQIGFSVAENALISEIARVMAKSGVMAVVAA